MAYVVNQLVESTERGLHEENSGLIIPDMQSAVLPSGTGS